MSTKNCRRCHSFANQLEADYKKGDVPKKVKTAVAVKSSKGTRAKRVVTVLSTSHDPELGPLGLELFVTVVPRGSSYAVSHWRINMNPDYSTP